MCDICTTVCDLVFVPTSFLCGIIEPHTVQPGFTHRQTIGPTQMPTQHRVQRTVTRKVMRIFAMVIAVILLRELFLLTGRLFS